MLITCVVFCSVSADPLQFIKSKGAAELAMVAEAQIRLATESKKDMKVLETRPDDDNTDWQSVSFCLKSTSIVLLVCFVHLLVLYLERTLRSWKIFW
jgi:hypothetical protein